MFLDEAHRVESSFRQAVSDRDLPNWIAVFSCIARGWSWIGLENGGRVEAGRARLREPLFHVPVHACEV